MLTAHIPPGSPPGGFLKLKPCVKITYCIPGVVLDPLRQVTSWGEGAVLYSRPGFEARRGAGTLEARA